MGGGLGLGSVTFTIETKRANLAAVLEILRQILREPTPAGQRVRGDEERARSPASNRADPIPCAWASTTFSACCRIIPATTSATCRPSTSRSSASRRLSLDQVRSLYRDYLGADHGELVIVGDFEPSEILPILAKTFDGWKSEKPYARIERPYQADIKPQRETILTPDKENAVYPGRPQHADQGRRSRLSGPAGRQLHSGRRRSLVPHRRSPAPEGGLSYTAMSMLQASPLDPRADLHDPGDL